MGGVGVPELVAVDGERDMTLRLRTGGGVDAVEIDTGPVIGRIERCDVPYWRSGRRVRLATGPGLVGGKEVIEGV